MSRWPHLAVLLTVAVGVIMGLSGALPVSAGDLSSAGHPAGPGVPTGPRATGPGGNTSAPSTGPSTPSVYSWTGFGLDRSQTTATSAPFGSQAGAAIFVWFALNGQETVASVSDSAGDHFTQLSYATMAYGTTGAYNGLAIWWATNTFATGNLTLNVTIHPHCATCLNNTAVTVVDVTGVGPQPLDARGSVLNSSGLPGEQSAGFASEVPANASDLVLGGVAARNFDRFGPVGGDSLVGQQVEALSERVTDTIAVFQTVAGANATAWVNGTDNETSAWVAEALALKAGPTGSPPIQHVVVIMLENSGRSTVLEYAPYQAYLAETYGQATEFYGVCHGSLPNYMAVTSGRYYACGDQPIEPTPDRNIADVLEAAGLGWDGFFEGMNRSCQTDWGGEYDAQHNPFILYNDIEHNASRCDAHVLNSAAFNESVAAGTLPAFSFYVPNLRDDCERTNLTFCDTWLRGFLSPLLNSTNASVRALVGSTAFFVLYDEGLNYAGFSSGGVVNGYCENSTGEPLSVCGGNIYLSVVSPYSRGATYTANATDYNLASTIEWLLGVGSDGGYDGSSAFPAMTTLFSFSSPA